MLLVPNGDSCESTKKTQQFPSWSIVFAPRFIMRRKCFKLRLLIRNYSHCLSFNQLMWLVILMFLPRQIGIDMSACLCIWLKSYFKVNMQNLFKPIWRIICITLQGYKGQYNNFNAILWNFSVALRAKDVFVKYGNCHEQSH